MRALTFPRFGGPEVLEVREVPDSEPRPGHAVVRLETGWPSPTLTEGAGRLGHGAEA
jgi:NADPH2:quinone reductase